MINKSTKVLNKNIKLDTLIRNKPSTNVGFNVFYRYTQDNVYPFREDFHIGRICCTPIMSNTVYLGSNRCN